MLVDGSSIQTMSRMDAIIDELNVARHWRFWEKRMRGMVAQSFGDTEERAEALKRNRQGLGSPRVNVAVR